MHIPQTSIGRSLRSGRNAAALSLLCATVMIAAPGASANTLRHASRHGRRADATRVCANAATPAVAATNPVMDAAVVCLINQQRVDRHLPALNASSALDRSAHGWNDEMLRSGVYWHGANFSARITAAGFVWSTAGENIATGFRTPRDVVNAWMGSTDHCRNILDPAYSSVGTGVGHTTHGPFGGTVAWTQDFGLPRGKSSPSSNWGPADGCP